MLLCGLFQVAASWAPRQLLCSDKGRGAGEGSEAVRGSGNSMDPGMRAPRVWIPAPLETQGGAREYQSDADRQLGKSVKSLGIG